jgi:hypothetical protein
MCNITSRDINVIILLTRFTQYELVICKYDINCNSHMRVYNLMYEPSWTACVAANRSNQFNLNIIQWLAFADICLKLYILFSVNSLISVTVSYQFIILLQVSEFDMN